jgi:dethiobiotin synthetase
MRIVVLGCGTGVGKTRLSVALLRAIGARGVPTLGLKPIESGIARGGEARIPPKGSDAAALADAASLRAEVPYPLHALPDPVSPHLAARSLGLQLDLGQTAAWVAQAELSVAPHVGQHRALYTVVETAGGVFSPLGPGIANFELAQRLDPAVWVLVAADALGVLHEVRATLTAMRACGREPDHLVLSAAREPDASTGTNAAELSTLGIATPRAVLARNDDRGVSALVDRLLATEPRRVPAH